MNASLLTKWGVNSRSRCDNTRMNFISFSQSSQNTNRDGTSMESERSNASSENEIIARSRHLEILDLLHGIKSKVTDHDIRFNELEMQITSNKSAESVRHTINQINRLTQEISKKLELFTENIPILSSLHDDIFRIHRQLEMETKYRSKIANYLQKISRYLSCAKDEEGYFAWESCQARQICNAEICYEDEVFFEGSTTDVQSKDDSAESKLERKVNDSYFPSKILQEKEKNPVKSKTTPLTKAEDFEISSQISTEIEL